MMLRFGNFSSRIAVPTLLASHFRVGVSITFTSMRTCSSSSQQQQDDPDHLKKLASAFSETAKEHNALFRTPHGAETILDILESSVSQEAIASMGKTITETARRDGQFFFTTPRAIKVMLDALSRSATADCVNWVAQAISAITMYNREAKRLFSSREAVKIIFAAFHRATSADSAEWIATVVQNIAYLNSGGPEMLTIPEAVPAFKAVIPYATTDEAADWVLLGIHRMLYNNAAAAELLGTQDFIDVFKTLKPPRQRCYEYNLAYLEDACKRRAQQLCLEIEQLEKEIVSFREQLEAKEMLKKEKQSKFDKLKL